MGQHWGTVTIRPASTADADALREVRTQSILNIDRRFYSDRQIAAGCRAAARQPLKRPCEAGPRGCSLRSSGSALPATARWRFAIAPTFGLFMCGHRIPARACAAGWWRESGRKCGLRGIAICMRPHPWPRFRSTSRSFLTLDQFPVSLREGDGAGAIKLPMVHVVCLG